MTTITFQRFGPLVSGSTTNEHGDTYSLGVREDAPTFEHMAVFHFKSGQNSALRFPITARDLPHYHRSFPRLRLDSSLQFTEVGSGLGGLVPYLAQTRAAMRRMPIAIDPADYQTLLTLTDRLAGQANELRLSTEARQRLDIIRSRCDILLDASRVRLVNTTLCRAVTKHPELHGCSDVVVDHYGGKLYPQAEGNAEHGRTMMEAARKTLLKKDGMELC